MMNKYIESIGFGIFLTKNKMVLIVNHGLICNVLGVKNRKYNLGLYRIFGIIYA